MEEAGISMGAREWQEAEELMGGEGEGGKDDWWE